MGLQDVKQADAEELRQFMKLLLRDVRALEKMLDNGMLESGVRRIGAEQELFLIDPAFQAAKNSLEVLDAAGDEHFTTELGRFNIEYNLDPLTFGGDCLRQMEHQVVVLWQQAREAAQSVGSDILMTGILPTLRLSDLTLDNMTPNPRYFALNDALCKQRGGAYNFHIKGADEFIIQHDNVMLESCNTSFQVHFQVGPEEFAPLYNIAQACAAPVMAVGVNSPLLFGKRLWQETRIALFQQSIDTRGSGTAIRERMPRVSFGTDWVKESVLEIFREDISRFRVLLNTDVEEDPFEAIEAGRAPLLKALRLHNGTVYRWNRAVYGISEGKPHLRIENRVLPAGPTPLDEIANAAFWFGLMISMVEEYGDITQAMDFDDAKSNFVNAARQGLGAHFTWTRGRSAPAKEIILDRLVPMAREGLAERNIDSDDIDRYLGVIEARVKSEQTGASWLLNSYARLSKDKRAVSERLSAITSAILARQKEGKPVHEWPLAEPANSSQWRHDFHMVGQFMTTDLFTVNQDELIDLVASVMDWQHIRHVPVEDDEERLVGIVNYRAILRHLTSPDTDSRSVPVSSIMEREIVSVTPDTRTLDVIRLMRDRKLSCVPVVHDQRLVGMITEQDFMEIAQELLEQKLEEETEAHSD